MFWSCHSQKLGTLSSTCIMLHSRIEDSVLTNGLHPTCQDTLTTVFSPASVDLNHFIAKPDIYVVLTGVCAFPPRTFQISCSNHISELLIVTPFGRLFEVNGLPILSILLISLDIGAVQDRHLDTRCNHDEETGTARDPHSLPVIWLVGLGEDSGA